MNCVGLDKSSGGGPHQPPEFLQFYLWLLTGYHLWKNVKSLLATEYPSQNNVCL